MKWSKQQSGYVLILAIGIVTVMSLLVFGIVNQVIVYNRLTITLADREQARLLALSGIQIAIGQLSDDPEKSKKEDGKVGASPKDKQESTLQKSLKKLVPLLNRWQTFSLAEKEEDSERSCEIYIASEQGKININSLYDFKQKKFIKEQELDGAKIIQQIGEKFGSAVKDQSFAENLKKYIQERGKPLDDVTQIAGDAHFKKLKDYIFISPTTRGSGKNDHIVNVALLDMLTVDSKSKQVQPWFLTASAMVALGFKDMQKNADKKVWDTFFEQLKGVHEPIAWQQKWDTLLAPVLGKGYSSIGPEIRGIFAQELDAASFSVVSYGKFGGTTVKVYAILYKKLSENGDENNSPVSYCIKKLYWI